MVCLSPSPSTLRVIHAAAKFTSGTNTKGIAIYVGDTEYDVSGAKEHGLPCIGVSWGYGTVGNMRNAGALQIVNTMEELHGALQG